MTNRELSVNERIENYLKRQREAYLGTKKIGLKLEREIEQECKSRGYTYYGSGLILTSSGFRSYHKLTDGIEQMDKEFYKKIEEWYTSSLELIKIGIETILKKRTNSLYLFADGDTLVGKVLGGYWYYLSNLPEKIGVIENSQDYTIERINFALPEDPNKVCIPSELNNVNIDLVFTKFDASGFTESGAVFSHKLLNEGGILTTEKAIFDGILKDLFTDVNNDSVCRIANNWTSLPSLIEVPVRSPHLVNLPGKPYEIRKPVFLRKRDSNVPM